VVLQWNKEGEMQGITILQTQFATRLGRLSSIGNAHSHRLIPITALVAVMIFSLGSLASAGSSFSWTSPWVVNIDPHCTGNLFPFPDQCLGSRGFGDAAPPESIRGTEDEHAVAWMQSGGRVRGTLLVGTINFSREFTLRGASNVALDGLLSGETRLFNPQSARSMVTVTADIVSIGNATPLLSVNYGDIVQNTSGHRIDSIDKGYQVSLTSGAVLSDGQYRITGQLTGFHITTWGLGEIGFADYRWTVGAVATPLPEPSTWLLLLCGVIGLLSVRGLKFRISTIR
jgi:hypothetical protein